MLNLVSGCFSSASGRTGAQSKAIALERKVEWDGEQRTALWEMLH